ncbi:hypothetical protein EZV62_002430 [Acer yangbiense]|uniref:F-box domain-containing protein n=1 Tax=Acer yangbiense TaxID=1000413 RepID=A0A5C7IX41_9ROSI|nr:hypothetical protein EZV62_002430 [Acer yangbiense]
MEDSIVAVDRISELPDFIIHHIMSYLSTPQVTQTSVLSKRWNHLRSSYPILDFDQIYFEEEDLETKTIDKFIRFVDASLLRFCEAKVSMQKFRVSMTVFDVESVSSLVDKWIGLAVASEVKELDLNVQTNDDTMCSLSIEEFDLDVQTNDNMYSPPGTIFSSKFVTTLKLRGCNLEKSSAYTIKFHSLKKLELNKVHIDEQMVQKFISECPLLEDLVLSICWHCKRICVSHLPKLNILTIDTSSSISYDFDNDFYHVESIEIVAPSLQQCTLVCVKRPCMIEMAGCADLKYFNLTFSDILDQEFHNLISKFPLLEKLVVCDCFHLERVALSSNRLKELQIHQVIHSSCLSYIDIDAPNLLTFSYECYSKPARSINVSHPCSWKVGVSHKCYGYEGLIWFDSIKKLLELAYDVEELSISISIWDTVDSFTLDKFQKCSPSLPREVGNLTINAGDVQPSSYAALLDCLLWICYPRILSIKAYHGSSSIEFIMSFGLCSVAVWPASCVGLVFSSCFLATVLRLT